MARKTITVCDRCGGEADRTYRVSVGDPGQRGAGRRYDACGGCAAVLEDSFGRTRRGRRPAAPTIADALTDRVHADRRELAVA